VVERSIAVDDLGGLDEGRIRVVEIEHADRDLRPALTQQLGISRPTVCADDGAGAVEEETSVIADTGTDLENRSLGERQAERRGMLEPTRVVTQILIGPKFRNRVNPLRDGQGDGGRTARALILEDVSE